MTFDLSTISTYAAADKLKAVDQAIMTVLLGGQVIAINGRTRQSASLDQLRAYRQEVVSQMSDEDAASSNGIALVRYGDRV